MFHLLLYDQTSQELYTLNCRRFRLIGEHYFWFVSVLKEFFNQIEADFIFFYFFFSHLFSVQFKSKNKIEGDIQFNFRPSLIFEGIPFIKVKWSKYYAISIKG